MYIDYKFIDKKETVFAEVNTDQETIESILSDYRQEVKNTTAKGFLRFLRGYGYKVNELIDAESEGTFIIE